MKAVFANRSPPSESRDAAVRSRPKSIRKAWSMRRIDDAPEEVLIVDEYVNFVVD